MDRRTFRPAAPSFIHFASTNDVATDSGAFSVDNIRLVPEPSSLLSMVAAAAGLLLRRRSTA